MLESDSLEVILRKESEEGFDGEPREKPPFIPFSVGPMKLVPKADCK